MREFSLPIKIDIKWLFVLEREAIRLCTTESQRAINVWTGQRRILSLIVHLDL